MKDYLVVEQTDELPATPAKPDQGHDHDLRDRKQRISRFWGKLGAYNTCIIICGSGAILIAVTFLALLWAGSKDSINGGTPQLLWYTMVNNRWATRVVTISSAVIRIATAAQLCVFAAAVAALILETAGASVVELPLLSIVRCVNTGPNSLFGSMLSSFREGGLQLLFALVVGVAILNGLALQFTSTILLGDFGTAAVVLGSNATEVFYGMNESQDHTRLYQGIDYWRTAPSHYARFAEFRDRPYEADAFVDTGKLYRAILPFGAREERQTLRNFTGATTVFDARVICVRPTIEDFGTRFQEREIAFDGSEDVHGNDTSRKTTRAATPASVAGFLDWPNNFPGLAAPRNSQVNRFNCTMHLLDVYIEEDIDASWPISLCPLPGSVLDMTEGIRTDNDAEYAEKTEAYLLLNTTGSRNRWNSTHPSSGIDNKAWTSSSSSGPWLTQHYKDLRIDASLCFMNPSPWDYVVELRSASDFSEPTVSWNRSSGTHLTQPVRHMLGATADPSSLEERGVFELLPPTSWLAQDGGDNLYKPITDSFIQLAAAYGFQYGFRSVYAREVNKTDSILLAPMDTDIWSQTVHRAHVAMVQDILRETRNPALALQALFTVLMQMAYYDFLPQFDVSATAVYALSSNNLIPVKWKGFAVVVGLLFLHFGIVLSTVVAFLIQTKVSLLGNAWQTIAQVVSDDMEEAINQASDLTDTEVKELLGMSGTTDGMVLVKRSVKSGRNEVVTHSRRLRRSPDSKAT